MFTNYCNKSKNDKVVVQNHHPTEKKNIQILKDISAIVNLTVTPLWCVHGPLFKTPQFSINTPFASRESSPASHWLTCLPLTCPSILNKPLQEDNSAFACSWETKKKMLWEAEESTHSTNELTFLCRDASISLCKCHQFTYLLVRLTCEWARCQQLHTNMTELVGGLIQRSMCIPTLTLSHSGMAALAFSQKQGISKSSCWAYYWACDSTPFHQDLLFLLQHFHRLPSVKIQKARWYHPMRSSFPEYHLVLAMENCDTAVS